MKLPRRPTYRPTFHPSVSVDAALKPDAELWALVPYVPGASSPVDVRRACEHARARGFRWVPPCNEHVESGLCRGHYDHPMSSIEADTWGT